MSLFISVGARKGNPIMYDLEDKINASVFPGLQGGPHNQSITALAVALKQANAPEFKTYIEQVIKMLREQLGTWATISEFHDVWIERFKSWFHQTL